MLRKLIILAAVFGVILAQKRELTQEEVDKLASWDPNDKYMWVESGQEEGDMVLSPEQRSGLINTRFRWANRVIPYEIDRAFTTQQANFIHNSVREFANVSCVTVRPRTASDRDWVLVTGENSGCWSWVGRQEGRQQLNLQRNGCLWHNIVVHEFLHAAGFFHEQSRYDRDNHVRIQWNNIQRGTEHNFDMHPRNTITTFGEAYDLGSILHYHETAFSTNGRPTIVPLNPAWVGHVGRADRMSSLDIRKLRAMYC